MTLDLKKPQTMKVRPVCLNSDIPLDLITILGSTHFTLYQLQLLDIHNFQSPLLKGIISPGDNIPIKYIESTGIRSPLK